MLDIKQVYSFNFPTPIRFGAGVIKELGPYLKNNNLSSPLLVTDLNVAELNFFKEIQKSGKNGRRIFRSISVFSNFVGTRKIIL